MKKKSLKSLSLNKQTISNLQLKSVKGGDLELDPDPGTEMTLLFPTCYSHERNTCTYELTRRCPKTGTMCNPGTKTRSCTVS